MRSLAVLFLCFAVHALPRAAAAVSISLVPSSATVNVGDTVTIALEVSALAGAAVGGFDVDVSFDPSRFTWVDVVWSGALGDVGAGEQLPGDVVAGPGSVNVASVSLLDPVTLAGLQGDPLTIVSLTFQATAAGTGAFALTAQLADAFAGGLPLGSQTGTSVDVVPEPALATLLALGALALARRRPPPT
jgi:MYXO-CTERM domain-containing protein